MLSQKTLYSIIKQPILLSFQKIVVTSFLKRLSEKRYHSFSAKKSYLFKVLCPGAEPLICQYLKSSDDELAKRYTTELVLNKGYQFYSQNWKAHCLLLGLLHFNEDSFDLASYWLANGVRSIQKMLSHLIVPESYPDNIVKWFKDNEQNLQDKSWWKNYLIEAGKKDLRDDTVIKICCLLGIGGLKEQALIIINKCKSTNSKQWKKNLSFRFQDFESDYLQEFNADEIHENTYDSIEQKICINICLRTFSPNSSDKFILDNELDTISNSSSLTHLKKKQFLSLSKAMNAISRAEFKGAIEILKPQADKTKAFIDSLKERSGPTKVFLAGFGWSGSSAVHDGLRAYPHTNDMPGAGDIPYLNEGADSEPMLHQGPASMVRFIAFLNDIGSIPDVFFKEFYKNYILLMDSYQYLEYKLVNANRNIINNIGLDTYYSLISDFLFNYANAALERDAERIATSITDYQQTIVNSMFKDHEVVFFNNSLYPYNSSSLKYFKGKTFYIVVHRNRSDQFCDQKKSNKLFNATFLEFFLVQLRRKYLFNKAKKQYGNSISCIEISFESWVKNIDTRKMVSEKIMNNYDEKLERIYFNPKVSIKNIHLSNRSLSFFNRACMKIFEKLNQNFN